MGRKPLIAIVGRPNVGKSTLFNRIAGERIAIVENIPGVTRDRIYADSEWCGKAFTIIDTGGLELKSEDEMWSHIRAQAELAIDTADVICYVADGKTGLTKDDNMVASFLRKSKKPVIVCVNKLDNNETHNIYDFYALGFGEPIGISAEQGKGIGDLLDTLLENLPKVDYEEESDRLKIAIVGKPNAGKSSLVNKLLGFDRVIVSDVAGTTRDAIDTELEYEGEKFTLIDTAGIRKRGKVKEDLERYSVMRALAAVRRADVAVLVCDANEGMTEQDVKIAGYIHDEGKPAIIALNKWDIVEKDEKTAERLKAKVLEELKFMDYVTPIFISAKTGKRVDVVLKESRRVYANASRRIPTGLLNEVLMDAVRIVEPPSKNGRRLKMLYSTQVAVNPPTFVVKVNEPELMHFSYRRYLENALRKSFDFSGTPIKILSRKNDEE